MDCEVCLSEKPSEESTLRVCDLSAEEVRSLLKGMNIEISESTGSLEIHFRFQEELERAKELLGDAVYSEGDSMEKVVGDLLREKGMTLSCAESCTGGLVGARIVNVPGSSDYFVGGVIVYSNRLKVDLLGVKEETLRKHGAVSRQTCQEMLEGLRKKFGTDTGIAITGIAGPGGSENKPEGLTYIGVYAGEKKIIEERIFEMGRNANRFLSSQVALNLLRKMILEEES